jgi:type II secretory pathway pseudopilin PulG
MKRFQRHHNLRPMRRGVSLLEVMIAIGVTSIGLLGVLALIPLAGHAAKQGQITERAASIGNSAISEMRTRHMLDPRYWTLPDGSLPVNLLTQRAVPLCIDSRAIARGTAGVFPLNATVQMNRITLRNSVGGAPISTEMADHIFQSQDDLSLSETERDRTLPPYQLWAPDDSQITPTASPTRRQFEGSMSWMATIRPRWDGVEPLQSASPYTGAQGQLPPRYRDLYQVSVAVFYRRVLGEEVTTQASTSNQFFLSGGIAGGDTRFVFNNVADAQVPTPENSWLMVMGQMRVGNVDLPVFQWYRVLASDPDAADATIRYVTLDGPDWNMAATNVQATIIPGTVAVYEKTLRLETSNLWSSDY